MKCQELFVYEMQLNRQTKRAHGSHSWLFAAYSNQRYVRRTLLLSTLLVRCTLFAYHGV